MPGSIWLSTESMSEPGLHLVHAVGGGVELAGMVAADLGVEVDGREPRTLTLGARRASSPVVEASLKSTAAELISVDGPPVFAVPGVVLNANLGEIGEIQIQSRPRSSGSLLLLIIVRPGGWGLTRGAAGRRHGPSRRGFRRGREGGEGPRAFGSDWAGQMAKASRQNVTARGGSASRPRTWPGRSVAPEHRSRDKVVAPPRRGRRI